jgi:hypothetical protein
MDFVGDLNRKFEHAPHCSFITTSPPTRPWKPQSLWLTATWLWFPILPTHKTSPPAFVLFPKLKIKLKGRRFETASDIQRESQAVLDSIKKNDFHSAFEAWKNDRITIDVPKELFWRRWQQN